MKTNLFFLCGPHGSGKTTLGNEMGKENPKLMIPELYSRTIKFHAVPDYRQALKICQRAIENFEYVEIADKNPDKIVLGNRCIYDNLAYHHVYFKRKWISEQDYYYFNEYAKYLFRNELTEPFAIVVNPGFDVCKRHLQKRWAEKEKKYREEDLEYLAFACEAYERLKGNEKILYFDKEIDLQSRAEIKEANSWLEKINGN